MFNVQGVFVFLIIAQRHECVTSLSLCDTDDGYLEVEDKSDNRFTCRNITATSTVSWLIADPNGNDVNLGTCPPPTTSQQSSCSASSLAPVFTSYRNSSDVSILNVDARAGGDPGGLVGLPLTCRTEISYAKCQIDYVYRASNASCTVQFTNIHPWSVSGQCNIAKVFSGSGRYRCRVYEHRELQAERKLIGNSTMSTTPTEVDAFSGNCTFRSYLPADGRYSYKVIVGPGEVEFPVVFTGSNEIRRPLDTPNHNCPDTVQEGQNVQCACSVSDYGAPSGMLQWDNTGSTQLSLTNVTRGDTGRRFVCGLTWNATDVLTVNYTLTVRYPAVILSVQVNNSTNMSVAVDENSQVTLSCEANGRPAPRMRLINGRDQELSSVPVGDVLTPDMTREVTYHFSKVQCSEGGTYRCDVDNGVGKYSKTVMILVHCSPRGFVSDKPFRSLTFQDNEVRLQFNLTAYPTPEVVSITCLGPSGVGICSGRPVPNSTVSAECSDVKDQFSTVVCTATVYNVTSDEAGIYKVTVRNSLGQMELVFEVKTEFENEPFKSDDCTGRFACGIGVGIGITLGVFGVPLIARVIWMRQRNWVLPCRRVKENTPGRSMRTAASKDGPDSSPNQSGNDYEPVGVNDMGMASVYSPLSGENQNTRESTDYELATEAASNQEQRMHDGGGHRLQQADAVVDLDSNGRSMRTAAGKDGPDSSPNQSGNDYDALRFNDVGMASVYSTLSGENQNTRESTDYELATEAASNQEQPMHDGGGHRLQQVEAVVPLDANGSEPSRSQRCSVLFRSTGPAVV